MEISSRKLGDYTGLAESYSRYRQGYCPSVLSALLALVERPVAAIDAVDVGAGTGIWTRMLAGRGLHSVTAVEPNADMRACGQGETTGVTWRAGTAEATGLPGGAADLLTMASSFHWADTAAALGEFARVLRPKGRFAALWNPRMVELSPLLTEIEDTLRALSPAEAPRVSSGRSGIADRMTDILTANPLYEDVVYIEGRHAVRQSPEDYLGAWRSVNEVQVRLGAERFAAFLGHVERRIEKLPYIETVYLTRAWSARRAG